MRFPSDFLWGAATAAAQIEGATGADGRTPSVWDVFSRRPGATADGFDTSGACDHYRRMVSDVELMSQIGLKAYRFSVAWSRVMPDASGEINAAGVSFYRALVDRLLEAGIEPVVTLFHWDMPQWLYEQGGWLNRRSAKWFADYAQAVASALPEVRFWITHNEPVCCCELGHRTGDHAPGDRHDWPAVLRVAHHLLLSHGRAVERIRAVAPAASIGVANTAGIRYPRDPENPADVNAARQANFAIRDTLWGLAWWSDPAYLGQYPADGLTRFGHLMPEGFESDLPDMAAPLDFFGLNVYTGEAVYAASNDGDADSNAAHGFAKVPFPPGYPRSPLGWDQAPRSMYWGPKFLHERYGIPIMITENGLAGHDAVSLDGKVHDPARIDYTHRYLLELAAAMRAGVPVLGYMHWSLMDNFEWAHGYRARFGLIHVDFATQRRIVKDSGVWYRRVIKSRGACLGRSVDRPSGVTTKITSGSTRPRERA